MEQTSAGTILITGGAGFIGSHFISYLLDQLPEVQIINLDNLTYAGSRENLRTFEKDPRHVFVKGDIRDRALLKDLFSSHRIQGVLHFAAESHVDNSIDSPEPFIQTNINGTFALLETVRSFWSGDPDTYGSCRFHHISTDEVFGSLGDQGCFTESSPYAPNSPYSASKAASDLLVRSYNKTYGLNTVITNCSNNYGPRQHLEKLIPTVIKTALSGADIPIYGDGSNVRDWLFVRDHCDALLSVYQNASPGSQYLIGGGYECSNMEMAHTICEILDAEVPKASGSYKEQIRLVADRPGHDHRYAISNERIRTDLGWTPSTPFRQGMEQTVQWYIQALIKR